MNPTFKALTAAVSLLAASASASAAEGLYWPHVEAQALYSNLSVSGEAQNPSNGYGGKLSVGLFSRLELIGEGSFNTIETNSVDIDSTQARAGFRYHWAATNGVPVYSALSVQYARYKLDAQGVSPQIDELPIAHVRAGYRTEAAHVYGEYGYGSNGHYEAQELLAGLGYSPFSRFRNLELFGEYRTSRLEPDDQVKAHIRFKDVRLGAGFRF